ncbi:nodulation protein NfeD [Marinimicrobium sp. ABcell2]|uniref:NfeD family protein n=1 Tax=Marinimicrobium sp. ABcell2 TaxID=3069751 RepID=UPI0027B80038|nr:nodulation protein NfeD [Marinimicrobium sp. ABcell2]MDQ2076249.1 nodulation protein NfeD [Marinimicrobium sp. ABcell2]
MRDLSAAKTAPPNWRLLRLGGFVLVLLAGLMGLAEGQVDAGPAPVYQVDIKGVINPGSLGLLRHAIERAETEGAEALVVRINTPGGLLSSTRDMVAAISESGVPVIGYVGPAGAGATSAGAFILLSTHVAVMNDGTTVGASSPVAGDGQDIDSTMAQKVLNDTRAFMRSIAKNRGRDADTAERFVTEAESLTADEALEHQVIDLVIPDASALMSALEGREFQFKGESLALSLEGRDIYTVSPRLMDRLMDIIAHPQIAHLLISLGMLALYIELLNPGLMVPGVVGVIAMILGLMGVQTLPVHIGFLMLLFLGLGLMVAEYFVSGFGVLGIGGAAAFIIGSLNLFDMPADQEHQEMVLSVSVGVSAAILLGSFLISYALGKSGAKAKNKSLVGKTGEAMVSFDRTGYVLINDRRWLAETTEPLRHGDQVVVVAQTDDDRLQVKKGASS